MSSHRGGAILFLNRLGYRYDTPSFQEVVDTTEKKKVTFPYCSHLNCCGTSKQVWKRHLHQWQRRCPDCGAELIWRDNLTTQDEKRVQRQNCAHHWIPASKLPCTARISRELLKNTSLTFCKWCYVASSNFEKGWDFWHL